MNSSKRALQACRSCRQLKRRCTKELPSCSLCVRLHKDCRYLPKPKPLDPEDLDRQTLIAMVRHLRNYAQQDEQHSSTSWTVGSSSPASSEVNLGAVTSSFPLEFFLDPDFLSPMSQGQQSLQHPAPCGVMELIGDRSLSICHDYFANVQLWLSIVSPQRLYRKIENVSDATTAALVLSMKLLSMPTDPGVTPSDNPWYCWAKQLISTLQATSTISLSFLQAIVMIASYEVGHGLLPAGYLTVGLAARLGVMMGLHCWIPQSTTQLYKSTDSWSLCEERRRTWWAIFVLDRYINLGPRGLPLATPEPNRGDLLPSDDTRWDQGEIGPNEPVYAYGFSQHSQVGPFARTCQSSHMLGRVLRHRDEAHEDHPTQVHEALKLHLALTALDSHLGQAQEAEEHSGGAVKSLVSLALCSSARLTLYNLYSCNKPSLKERVAQESELQALSLDGTKNVAGERVPNIAREILKYEDSELAKVSPLVIQCLYHAATECQWFDREGLGAGMDTSFQLLMAALVHLAQRWKIAGMYAELLSREDTL